VNQNVIGASNAERVNTVPARLSAMSGEGEAMTRFWPVTFAALGAFALATGCWAAWGWATPGDFFANGSPFVYPTLLMAIVVGAGLGFYLRWRWVRELILVAAAGALWFHLFVPDGWWAKPLLP
jgi:hypothetical protein